MGVGVGSNILKYYLFLTFLTTLGCGIKKENNDNLSFSKSHILDKGSRLPYKQMGRTLDLAKIHDDFDGDKVPDLFDKDIDDDGVPNYADQYPYDYEQWGLDQDKDGITDFFDIEVLGQLKYGLDEEAAKIQSDLFLKRKIHLISGDIPFTKLELIQINMEFFTYTLSHFNNFKSLSIIYKHPDDQGVTRFAQYNHAWETIRIYQAKYLKENIFNFTNSLVHEVFHSIEKDHPGLYKEFKKKSQWSNFKKGYKYINHYFSQYELKHDFKKIEEFIQSINFPSNYAKQGPIEMFAECGTAYNILQKEKISSPNSEKKYDSKKYKYLQKYKRSPVYQLLKHYFTKLTFPIKI